MKRALSLIIVLAMVLCMIPFSAFAVDTEIGIGEDFVDGGNYALLEENNWLIEKLLWIPEESGTLKGINFTPYVEEVAEGEEGEDYSEIPVFFDVYGWDEFPEEGIEVTAGEGYEISLYTNDQNWKGTAAINFVGELGSQTNPYVIALPEAAADMGIDVINEVPVPAGQTVFCTLLFFSGETVRVEGEGVKIKMGEESFGSINNDANGELILENTVDLEIPEGMRNVEIKLSNKTQEDQTYTFNRVVVEVPVGTMDNPEEVLAGTYDKEFAAGAAPYYYQYTAEGNGTVKVSVNAVDAQGEAIGWMYQIVNNTTYAQNDTQWSDNNPVVNPDSMSVSEGDVIVVFVQPYDPADMWKAPAGTITTTIEFVAEGSEETDPSEPPVVDPEEPEIEYLSWGSVLNGDTFKYNDTEADQYYTYVAEKTGYLYYVYGEWAQPVTEGESVTIYVGPGEFVEICYADPVAMIGEFNYFSIDAAVENAWTGDTIVVLANVSSYDGIVLDPGVNMDLGEFTLTAPYVVAFGSVTGVPGVASIVADDVMLKNVTIADVEYAWTAGEGAYTLVEYKAPVVEDDEPIVASYNGKNYSLSKAIELAAADGTPEAPATVTLISDADLSGMTVVIEPGVKLDLQDYTLTVGNLVGLNGSYLTAVAEDDAGVGARLVVGQDNIALSSKPVYVDDGGYQRAITPVWDTVNKNYLFTKIMVYNPTIKSTPGGEVEGSARIDFGPSCKKYVRSMFTDANGTIDNDISIIITATYEEEGITVSRQYFYGAEKTGAMGRNTTLYCVMDGCDVLTDLRFSISIVSATGIEVVVDGFEYQA